jgi:L-ascorbate metabolism protein UlaG (beta-lactamase superfamily)
MRPRPSTFALALLFLILSWTPFAPPPAEGATAPVVGKLTWFGQSCFLLETAGGTRIVMDPYSKGIGYELPTDLKADVVTISHEHPDHNNVAMVANKPRVIHGLTPDRKGWTRVDEKLKDVAIRSVGVYHDDKHGAERGLNTVFVFEVGGLRIAHLGDLGHPLNDEQQAAIGSVDVLLIPVGGTFTIDARLATRLVDQLRPRLLVVPMHYRTAASTVKELDPVDEFLEGKPNVRRVTERALTLSLLKARPAAEIVVLPYH